MNDNYPFLFQFMGAYLHLDYETPTGTYEIKDVIDCYIAETPDNYLRRLVKEIEQFESEHVDNLNTQFESVFAPDIVIDSVHDFFELVKSKIQKHLEPST